MELKKIVINNFKSIQHLELDIKKYGTSYTTMFLWINESWKSNILEAISFFNVPSWEYNFDEYHNKRDKKKENKYVDLYFYLDFENKNIYVAEIKKLIKWWEFLNFSIENIEKNVYLEKGETEFNECYDYNIVLSSKWLFLKEINENKVIGWVNKKIVTYEIVKDNNWDWKYTDLNEENFKESFWEVIDEIIEKYEPTVSIWKPSENKYLLWDADLNLFKKDINSNIPLKNIFAIAWYTEEEEIISTIESISTDTQLRRELSESFSIALTKYVKEIWKHNIKFDIEFTDSNKCGVSVLDEWEENKFNFFKMTSRSQWFQHFISLIFSLSVETKNLWRNNRIIIIDEPEVHLHPSGIRDLRDELLRIWEKNYVFIATHSPFIIDKNYKERNILVVKNKLALTNIFPIVNENNILDDEILSMAFWVNVYKDLLLPNKILVEWVTDKIILSKLLNLMGINNCGITNWIWSNIVNLASIYSNEWVHMVVLVDSDNDWSWYKDKILKIWDSYTEENVFTIKDLVWNIKDWATIEDIFPKLYVENCVKQFYLDNFREKLELQNIVLEENKPFINQIKENFSKIMKRNLEQYEIDGIKRIISESYNPTKKSVEENELMNIFLKNLIKVVSNA